MLGPSQRHPNICHRSQWTHRNMLATWRALTSQTWFNLPSVIWQTNRQTPI